MADVFAKRCPCGVILRARQSCTRCTSEARARLHAAGLCDAERPKQPYDNGQHQGNAAMYKKPPLGKKPAWLDLELPKYAAVFRGIDFGHGDQAVAVTATVFPGGTYRIDDIEYIPAQHDRWPVYAGVAAFSWAWSETRGL